MTGRVLRFPLPTASSEEGRAAAARSLEERQLDALLALAPPLAECFQRLSMPEDSLKCRFLEGLALMASHLLPASVETFRDICREAERLGNEKLLGSAYANLTHVYG